MLGNLRKQQMSVSDAWNILKLSQVHSLLTKKAIDVELMDIVMQVGGDKSSKDDATPIQARKSLLTEEIKGKRRENSVSPFASMSQQSSGNSSFESSTGQADSTASSRQRTQMGETLAKPHGGKSCNYVLSTRLSVTVYSSLEGNMGSLDISANTNSINEQHTRRLHPWKIAHSF